MSPSPDSLKHAIAVGIGLLVALIGLQWGGLVADSPGTLVTLGKLSAPPALLTLFGLLVIGILLARGLPGALLIGILISTAVGLATGMVHYQGFVGLPPSIAPTLFQLDVGGALRGAMLPVILVFFVLALFDSVGTLVGVANQAGLLRDGTLPRARQALLADAIGTVAGAVLGTSTVTAYIESSTGVSAGGRTGLANMVTAALFILSLLFYPAGAHDRRRLSGGRVAGSLPDRGPALILVGALMMAGVREIPWTDLTEAIPAFLTMVMMPLTVSITEGIAFGFSAYAVLKLCTGRGREAHPLVYVCAALFVARYVWLM